MENPRGLQHAKPATYYDRCSTNWTDTTFPTTNSPQRRCRAVATGHPFGATGVPYALILATALRQRRIRSGAAGERIGSGQRVISVELWTLGAGALELPNVRVGGEGY
jgi:hypothetical protein